MRRHGTLTAGAVVLLSFAVSAWAADAPSAPGRPTSLSVGGMVTHAQSFTIDQIRAMPAHHVEASFTTMHGQDHHSWTGALLWDVVTKAGLKDEPGRRTTMRHTITVAGQDGYAAAFAIGEIDPTLEGKQVIIAYRQDDQPGDLPTLRLIVPGDKHGARDVHDVVSIDVK